MLFAFLNTFPQPWNNFTLFHLLSTVNSQLCHQNIYKRFEKDYLSHFIDYQHQRSKSDRWTGICVGEKVS